MICGNFYYFNGDLHSDEKCYTTASCDKYEVCKIAQRLNVIEIFLSGKVER